MSEPTPVFTTGTARTVLRLEGALVLVACAWIYSGLNQGWMLFLLVFFAPDLAAVGYLAGKRTGAAAYNALHTYLGPLALGIVGGVLAMDVVVGVALIWGAHIGFDRALGFGLKLPTSFRDTHLGRIGKG
ncbi:MAG: DUF4260 domain-containing protein [Bacteroidota bacterium]